MLAHPQLFAAGDIEPRKEVIIARRLIARVHSDCHCDVGFKLVSSLSFQRRPRGIGWQRIRANSSTT